MAIDARHIETSSLTWGEIKRWAEAEIEAATTTCTTKGTPIIETEAARERIAVLRELLDSMKPKAPVVETVPRY